MNNLNLEINGYRINDAAEKIGALLFGDKGREIGRSIDNLTKDKTIVIDIKADEYRKENLNK